MLRYLASLYPNPAPLDPLIDALALAPLLNRPYRRLSGGEQQAVNLAGALVGRPELVLLDEPTAGMDPRARRRTWDLITGPRRRRGRAPGPPTTWPRPPTWPTGCGSWTPAGSPCRAPWPN